MSTTEVPQNKYPPANVFAETLPAYQGAPVGYPRPLAATGHEDFSRAVAAQRAELMGKTGVATSRSSTHRPP
jgi:hypothetical protein